MRRALCRTVITLAVAAAATSPDAFAQAGGAAGASASPGGEDKPLRAAARAEDIRAFYKAQLIEPLDRPVKGSIDLPGKTIPTRLDAKGQLQLDLRGDGKMWKTIYGSGGRAVPLRLEREGVKRPLSMKLFVKKQADGSWTYRNATQLTVQIGTDLLVVVDANSNGLFNEPGVDGMTWAADRTKPQADEYVFPLPKPDERWCTPGLELTGLTFGPWGEDVKVKGRALATTTPGALGVLKGVNEERVKLGLTPRPENVRLSSDLQKHCSYMQQNGKLQHGEEKGKPGYSPEGHKAGMRSIISMGTPPARVADGMVRTYFHRQDVVRPRARAFGVGYEGRYGGIDGRTDIDKSYPVRWPILCPAPEQKGITLRYSKESPDATPGDASAGYPITAYFGARNLSLTGHSLRSVVVTPRGSKAGDEIDCYEFDQKKGASPGMTKYQRCVCIMAKDPLQGSTTYEVTLEVEVEGAPWKKTWRFSTGSGSSRGRWRR